MVNGRVARASLDIKVNDTIEIAFGAKNVKVQVLNVAETVRKDDASLMYKIIE